MTHLRGGRIFLLSFYYKFIAKSVDKITLKIGQYLVKLEAKI